MSRRPNAINLPMFTIQIDRELYIIIDQLSSELRVNTYAFINKLLIMGIDKWSKICNNPKDKIDVNSNKLSKAKKRADTISEQYKNKTGGLTNYTIQMNNKIRTFINSQSSALEVKPYEFINKIIILGVTDWSRKCKYPEHKIDVHNNKLIEARKMSDKINKESEDKHE